MSGQVAVFASPCKMRTPEGQLLDMTDDVYAFAPIEPGPRRLSVTRPGAAKAEVFDVQLSGSNVPAGHIAVPFGSEVKTIRGVDYLYVGGSEAGRRIMLAARIAVCRAAEGKYGLEWSCGGKIK